MKFSRLAEYLEKLEKTTSRNEITAILAGLFKKATPSEIDKICYLILGELVPAYKGIEFNLAERMMVRILAQAFGKSVEDVGGLYKKKGDLGDVAYELATQDLRQETRISVSDVYERLMEIAKESGEGSQKRKINKMVKLLSELDPQSSKFVSRIPVGRLRLGFSEVTILDALSVMERGDKSWRPEIEAAYNLTADIGKIAQQVKKGGVRSLKGLKARPGVPIRPSLAERLPTAAKIIEKAGPKVGIEPKLDGFRTTIHVWHQNGKKQIATFSRNLENTTFMFPEITEAAKKLPLKSVILDGETIGYNLKTQKFLPFQETVTRKRKYGIAEATKKLPLRIFVFDVLYLNGKDLLSLPFIERRKILEKVLAGHQNGIRLADHKITSDPRFIEAELAKNVEAGLEGLVAKKLDAPYQAGARGFHWIKFKATTAALEHLRAMPAGRQAGAKKAGLLDTIDCVVMGAYLGRGKRASFGVGGFLLGVRGEDDRFYTISKLGSGLTDLQFRKAARRVGKLKAAKQPKEYVVIKEEIPDIWTKPELVVEILADEITLSSRHTARSASPSTSSSLSLGVEDLSSGPKGSGQAGRGYSLRFPRLVRFRDDKNPEDATTVKELEEMFKQQLGK